MTNTRQANLSHAVALFEHQARLAPEAIALEEGDVAWTYQDLNTRANKIAAALLGLGCTAETRVAVYLERSREWAASLLGILKAGAVYVPLDPHYPPARVAYMLTDSRPALVLTDRSLRNQLLANTGADQTKTLDLEDVPQIEALDPVIQLSPRQLAYIIYTSGSTGRPKGAMVEHRGLRNHLLAKVEDLGLGPSDAVAQNSPSSFDVSVWQVLAALVSGGRIRIVPEETAQDSERLLEECESHRITVLETVPAMLALMAEQQRERGAGRLPLARLRCLICNAEALPVTLCREWLSLYPRMNLVNAYGPTECSDDVTHYHVPAGIEGSGTALLGAPLRSTSIYIDGSGTEGEILIGGIGVGRGYFERPDLTAEKFVPDPFGSEPGARLYRTGDLGRWNDENLEFLGRIDHQVKLRGFRIELGEIEALLHQQSGVRHAVALVRPDLSGEPALFAWVAGLPGIDTDFLLDRLREALPNCMVPSAIIHVETFPVSPNGKIDRQALALPRHPSSAQPSLVGARTETEVERGPRQFLAKSEAPWIEPATAVEEKLAVLYREVLSLDRLSTQSSFFAIGGNSILATRLVARIRATFQNALPLRAIFENPDIVSLAKAVEAAVPALEATVPKVRPARCVVTTVRVEEGDGT